MARATAQIVMILLLATVLSACEPHARHRVLNFFFTGVPPLEETPSIETINDQPTTTAVNDSRGVASTDILYSHPLWLANICDPCHRTTGSFSTPGVTKKKLLSAFKKGGGMPADLTLAKNKLCIQCHTDKTPNRALNENLWLHNTTAKGECMACHDPHQSRFQKTLRQAPAVICISPCHQQGRFLATPAHQTTDECLFCHNPHMGINKNLLTKEHKELKVPVAEVPGYPELSR